MVNLGEKRGDGDAKGGGAELFNKVSARTSVHLGCRAEFGIVDQITRLEGRRRRGRRLLVG